MKTIELFHDSFCCPWFETTKEYLKFYCHENNHRLLISEVTDNDIVLKGFPFSIFIDNNYVTSSPVFPGNVEDIFMLGKNETYINDVVLKNGMIDRIERLTKANIKQKLKICTNDGSIESMEQFCSNSKIDLFGFLGFKAERPVVFLEYKKQNAKAIFNCFYSNSDSYDFKASFFESVENEILKDGIYKLEIIVGENSFYPNGTKKQFEQYGFVTVEELGEIYLLNRGKDRIYRMDKTL
jgi:hypothetical protein